MTVLLSDFLETTTETKMAATPSGIRDYATSVLVDPSATIETYRTALQTIVKLTTELMQKRQEVVKKHKLKSHNNDEEALRQANCEKSRNYYYANREKVLARLREKKQAAAGGGASST